MGRRISGRDYEGRKAMNEKILVTVDQATRMLSIGRSKLLELTYAGEIPSFKLGNRRLYSPSDLEAWAASLMQWKNK